MTMDVCLEPMNQPKKQEAKKRGFTLTEIAIVLGIVGLILGAIWVAAAAVYNNLRVTHANTAILQTVQGIRALYATTNTITPVASDVTAALITAGVIPKDLGTAAPLTDPWPSGVTNVESNAAGDGFQVAMTQVPQAACINLLVLVNGTNGDPGPFCGFCRCYWRPTCCCSIRSTRCSRNTPVTAAAVCVAGNDMVWFDFALKSLITKTCKTSNKESGRIKSPAFSSSKAILIL